MQAIQKEMPNAVIHTFFQLSLFGDVMDASPAQRDRLLSTNSYGLLPAFLNGMLDAAGPDIRITDGNEPSYYYTTPLQYYQEYHMVRQRALSMVAPENVIKYQSQVQVSEALYVDYVFGLGVWSKRTSPAPSLTADERARWFEADTYYALNTSDEYVWLYSEKMNWWKNQDLPPGLDAAVRSARAKVAEHRPLGFDMAGTLKAAEQRKRAEMESRRVQRTAEIPRLLPNEAPPIIDGRLDDPVWKRVPTLAAFLPYVSEPGPPKAATLAQVAYDDHALYLAIRCEEPRMAAMHIVGTRRDDDVWQGDSLDLFLSVGEASTPYVHLILNPNNVQWDARVTGQQDLGFNPAWQSATSSNDHEWRAEIAVPWASLSMKPPTPGEKLRANLCRNRIPGSEQTCWSQTFNGFVEPDNFGSWIFQ
jgi:hypothetical protein